ncbi:aldehyde dehydrogenase (NADP(+)) [Egibacter rhizosphaerae]|uniref:Aldehyde dehydrogenase (NADP(+)) n=1 Tax=Egibacter rhizosphaerae TaxID=1670831 RepID=A0A411YB58_9ACTN|nr:aldehyde dehydrogenase (NADP(+)) [Egibacter rhizosphaerae]QBI18419.1 aldehyde dehydrogenase (NADP(+)) [Egibacter rhizosphaerae]
MSTEGIEALTGANLVADRERAEGARFRGPDPRTGGEGPLAVAEATSGEVADAVAAAVEAAPVLAAWTPQRRAEVLRGLADALDADGEAIIAVADIETALGRARLSTELARTSNQLRLFADVVAEGRYLEATIDAPNPDVVPPRPDLRRQLVPLGPVAVFGASNFPLAFSVPGGDTASALAAGCPVVAKAHPSHPATCERTARALRAALTDAGAPPGSLSMVHGQGVEVGSALVEAPGIAAVGFTGSRAGGRALHDLAAQRDVPIPVYAEMSSLNPVFVTDGALAARGEEIADGFLQSMTMGTGQFCTKPGVLVLPDSAEGASFAERVAEQAGAHAGGPLLNGRIASALAEQLARTRAIDGVEVLAAGEVTERDGFAARPTVLRVPAERFLAEPDLAAEHFGPMAVLVTASPSEQITVAASLEGQLTATVHTEEDEADKITELVEELTRMAGRVVCNGYPTGVAVTHAMHHGGPYPATTNPLHTSVGSTAIRRFLRPVAYQTAPQALLPPALRDENPLDLPRLLDGAWTTAPVER